VADLTGLSTGTVQKAIRTLVDAKLLRIVTKVQEQEQIATWPVNGSM
jgi:hypothetical protein